MIFLSARIFSIQQIPSGPLQSPSPALPELSSIPRVLLARCLPIRLASMKALRVYIFQTCMVVVVVVTVVIVVIVVIIVAIIVAYILNEF